MNEERNEDRIDICYREVEDSIESIVSDRDKQTMRDWYDSFLENVLGSRMSPDVIRIISEDESRALYNDIATIQERYIEHFNLRENDPMVQDIKSERARIVRLFEIKERETAKENSPLPKKKKIKKNLNPFKLLEAQVNLRKMR